MVRQGDCGCKESVPALIPAGFFSLPHRRTHCPLLKQADDAAAAGAGGGEAALKRRVGKVAEVVAALARKARSWAPGGKAAQKH